jgi:hypothetical protein
MASSQSRSIVGPLTSLFKPPSDCTNFALVTKIYTTFDYIVYSTQTISYTAQGAVSKYTYSSYGSIFRTSLIAMPFHGRCDQPRSKNTCLPSGNAGVLSPAFLCPVGFSSALTIQPAAGAQFHHVYVSGSTYTLTSTDLLATAIPTSTLLQGETAILCCPMYVKSYGAPSFKGKPD